MNKDKIDSLRMLRRGYLKDLAKLPGDCPAARAERDFIMNQLDVIQARITELQEGSDNDTN